MSDSAPLLLPRRFWWVYAGLLAGVATFFALAELQQYLRNGGRHPWEPFLWEFSSVLVVAGLLPPIFRWHRASLGRGFAVLLARHALGYAAYTVLHVGGMFGLRFAVYALTPVSYEPGNAWQVLGYEAAKDLVFYVSNVLLCQLSDLLRASLSAQQRGWQTLAEEVALIQPYLALMQARFGERLQVRIELQPGTEDWSLPALLLLNPVENAIKHDVALSRGAVEVSLQAQAREDGLQVEIRNSGVSAEQVERAGGLGLSNLRERLHMAYGEAATLWIGPDQGGTLLRLQLPRREETA